MACSGSANSKPNSIILCSSSRSCGNIRTGSTDTGMIMESSSSSSSSFPSSSVDDDVV
eukprot:CAMPEP_0170446662 /NCGR_PEP_ID=MMETSP0117_2-20130122/49731_1 /TAXON_ID=400756 /ORGANISM="Durinskia baltica, Strain CSIRO CS-38" /LENGTH=57 /DNA_ID=CAMNT_0010707653 /DNA_START=18 /DNA_END=187 /DNA_ORIENTATION=-